VSNKRSSRPLNCYAVSRQLSLHLTVGIGPSFVLQPRLPRVPAPIFPPPGISCSGASSHHHVGLGVEDLPATAHRDVGMHRPTHRNRRLPMYHAPVCP